jgi:hypothetical protein
MIDLKFDIKGHLTPYERIALSVDEFKGIFIKSFDDDSTRYQIFEIINVLLKPSKMKLPQISNNGLMEVL